MKLEIARGMFLVAALGVTALAAAAWHEPGPGVVSSHGRSYCPFPPNKPAALVQARPTQDLLWLVLGLSQGLRPQG
ncbi:hypothetical protein [Phytopseudomonas dryadis]|uniref:Uncharacterized protein n=1 Tax=Phytopseudomonas dryadis TaxID=2487520 RepID=A0A4Q9QU36_9GAMM|nr:MULTISPECIES: hypothetical protein [Pseudomonas]TBU86546.1 hypothetical protein DNK44_22605 [Pseudomonas dryadis]TBV07256.1 hypothetical protein DNK34_08460 [Pseudomonas dryadis]TBV17879.1 hypothetical protein DNK41_12070 [Pseudomonas sp. FRB 230]